MTFHYSQSIILDVLRAIVSRPISIQQSKITTCRLSNHTLLLLSSPFNTINTTTTLTSTLTVFRYNNRLYRHSCRPFCTSLTHSASTSTTILPTYDDHILSPSPTTLRTIEEEEEVEGKKSSEIEKGTDKENIINNNKTKDKKKKEYKLIYRQFADKWVTGYYMKKPKRKPKNVDEYNELIFFAVANDQLNKAIKLFRDMEKTEVIQPDLRSYTMIINGFCIQSDMIKAMKWVKRLRQNGLRPDVYVYTSLIDGYMRTCNVDKTENVFKLMMHYKIKPNLVTYNVLMHHSVLKLDIEAAVQFWDKLLKAGLKPDVYTYAIMIHGLGGSQLVDEAWRIFEKMKKDRIDINHVVATTLMGIHVKHRDNAYAIQLFKQLFRNNNNLQSTIIPTQHTHNVLLNAVLGNTDLDKIKLYYQQFQSFLDSKQNQNQNQNRKQSLSSSSPSSSSSSSSSSSTLSSSSSPSSSLNSYSILFGQQEKVTNSAYTYTSFMRAFLRKDDIGMVSQVYQDMISRSVKPTVVTYSILMLAHAFVPDPVACENILNELKKHHIEVNTALYTIAMRAWAKANNWDQVKRVYDEMKINKIEPNKKTMEVLRWAKEKESNKI